MSGAVLRHSSRDAVLVLLAGGYGLAVLTRPSAALVALGIWWVANTVSHNFIHLPFFRSRRANTVFSAYLSLLLGVPQTLWRDRHIAHHAEKTWRMKWSQPLRYELALVVAEWTTIAIVDFRFFIMTWLPGWAGAMMLCWLQGYYEHVRGTVSHYGALYNLAFFNDGYHVEHHARPGVHWTALPRTAEGAAQPAQKSRWPAVLRWLELVHLNTLERIVLHSETLQRFVLTRHERALRSLLADLPPVRNVAIVGGGLFPRTALVIRRLIPGARISIIDMSAENIDRARPYLDSDVAFIESRYAPRLCSDADLVIVPLAFAGNRAPFYSDPPATTVLMHDWIWHRTDRSCVVSFRLLKRINVIRR